METVEHSVLENREHSVIGHLMQQFAVAHQFFYMIVHPLSITSCSSIPESQYLCEYSAREFVFRYWEFFQ